MWVDLTTQDGPLLLDGDFDNTDDDGTSDIGLTAGRTLRAATTLTLEATSGAITPLGHLTLAAQAGIVIHSDLVINSYQQNAVLDADTDRDGIGSITVNAGKRMETLNGNSVLTAVDLDLGGPLRTPVGGMTIHGSQTAQSIGLNSAKIMPSVTVWPIRPYLCDRLANHAFTSVTFWPIRPLPL